MRSPEFKQAVQQALEPLQTHEEQYVIKRDWSRYDGSHVPHNTDTDVVMLLQASPDRCALTASGPFVE